MLGIVHVGLEGLRGVAGLDRHDALTMTSPASTSGTTQWIMQPPGSISPPW
ncbi:MAG: hypothetical protein JXB07_01465 [Anaerolineae bacterium]|nr:hypothetical protein [Anaerolineae bacterium]